MENQSTTIDQLAIALYTINRHAKTAPEPQHLYFIKKETIKKLLQEEKAVKVGLHFSNHPKLSNQHSTLLVKIGRYYFHIPPEKADFKNLRHLGQLDQNYRNPKAKMSLSQAKRLIYRYIKFSAKKTQKPGNRQHKSPYYTPTFLGKMEWPPTKPRHRF